MRCPIKLMSVAALSVSVSGCALITEDTFQGAGKIIEDKKEFTKIDLPNMLDPLNLGPEIHDNSGTNSGTTSNGPNKDKFENAFHGFYNKNYGTDDDTQKLRRNRVVGRLVSASIQRCKEFKENLKLAQSQGNFAFGTLTTALAGAAAIFTPVNTTRTLAGSAGVVSGVRAEFNENFFASKIVEALTRAIDSQRQKILKEIDEEGKKSIEDYPVERAVADALRYHSACNLVTGLEVIPIVAKYSGICCNSSTSVQRCEGMTQLSLESCVTVH